MMVLMIVATLSVLIAKLLFHITVGPHFFKNLISYGVSSFAPSVLVLGMVLLVVNIVRSSGAAIALGVAFTLGINTVTAASQFLVSKAELLKWNPFNILLGTNQFSYDVTSQTHLTLINVIIGLIVYLILFYGIAFVIFNKRNV